MALQRYSDFSSTAAYKSRVSGARVMIKLIDEETGEQFQGNFTSINPNTNIEQVPTREAGAADVTEIVAGASEHSLSLDGYFTANLNDALLSVAKLRRRRFTAFQIQKTPQADGATLDTIIQVYRGWRAQGRSTPQGNSGVVSFSMSGPYLETLTGQEYATKYGG